MPGCLGCQLQVAAVYENPSLIPCMQARHGHSAAVLPQALVQASTSALQAPARCHAGLHYWVPCLQLGTHALQPSEQPGPFPACTAVTRTILVHTGSIHVLCRLQALHQQPTVLLHGAAGLLFPAASSRRAPRVVTSPGSVTAGPRPPKPPKKAKRQKASSTVTPAGPRTRPTHIKGLTKNLDAVNTKLLMNNRDYFLKGPG